MGKEADEGSDSGWGLEKERLIPASKREVARKKQQIPSSRTKV